MTKIIRKKKKKIKDPPPNDKTKRTFSVHEERKGELMNEKERVMVVIHH
jgi:hypothetical protein